jgi:Tfp pilus assembly protein PilO
MRKPFLIICVLAAAVLFYYLLIQPLEDRTDELRDKLNQEYATLEKYRGFTVGASVSREELSAARAGMDKLEKGVIPRTKEPVAYAELQLRLQDMMGKAGLNLTSIRTLPPIKQKGYATLPIYMEAEGGISELSSFLKSIDTPESYLRVEEMSISVKDLREQKDLRIKLKLSGLMKS